MAEYSAGNQSTAPPKLTCENVMTAVEGVNWDTLGFMLHISLSKLKEIASLYSGGSQRCQVVIQYWLGLDPSPSWRRVITALDDIGREGQKRADRIQSYAEPLTDPTLTLHNVTTAIATVEKWDTLCAVLGVPLPKDNQITQSYSTLHDKKQAAVLWWLMCAPGSSWARLAHWLCRMEESAALQQTLKYLKRPTDATLTLSNLSSALEAVDDCDWYALSYQLGIPESRLDELKRQSSVSVSSKQMMLREWMTSHPAPSWDIMTEVLYQEGYYHPRWHSILMEVKKLYGKAGVYERVSLNRYRIVRFLAANVSPGALADKLLVAGLISNDVREKALVTGLPVSETVRPMIDAVITRIELNAAKYDLFISVLRQFGSLEDLIEYIEMTF